MRVELYGCFGHNGDIKTFELDENFQGVTTHDGLHSGQYRVSKIANVRIYADCISILVELNANDPHSELAKVVEEPLPEPAPATAV